MNESFKITARELRRNLKMHISLPNDYDTNDNLYPLVVVFDGNLLYNFIGEETKVFDTPKMLQDIEDKALLLFLHSPAIPEWRMSELNPYYNGDNKDVDTVLAIIYYQYITKTLIPLLKSRYRFDLEQIYTAGFYEGAIAATYMCYTYKEYKGAALFSPSLDLVTDKFNEDLRNKFTCKKSIYLYHGGINSNTKDDDLFYHLCTKFDSLKTEILKYDFDSNLDNSYQSIEVKFAEGINHILKNKAPID